MFKQFHRKTFTQTTMMIILYILWIDTLMHTKVQICKSELTLAQR